jgi:hypothetical protein
MIDWYLSKSGLLTALNVENTGLEVRGSILFGVVGEGNRESSRVEWFEDV